MGDMSEELIISAIAVLLCVVLFIMVIVLWVKVRTMNKKYTEMMNGTGVNNLQEVLTAVQHNIRELQQSGAQTEQVVQTIHNKIRTMKSNLSMARYNAFNDQGKGSDMSFSVAFLDDNKNGAVLTGIHSREETYMYGKPIENGASKYPLTPEEKTVIEQALNGSK